MTNEEYIISFNQFLKECDTVYHNAAVKAGLSDCAFWILYTLQSSDREYTQSEVGDETCMPRQTVNSALKKLERDGYLTLHRIDGKQGKLIRLTEKGETFSAASIRPVMEAEVRACASFPEDEKDMFLSIFHSFVERLREELKNA